MPKGTCNEGEVRLIDDQFQDQYTEGYYTDEFLNMIDNKEELLDDMLLRVRDLAETRFEAGHPDSRMTDKNVKNTQRFRRYLRQKSIVGFNAILDFLTMYAPDVDLGEIASMVKEDAMQ